MPGKAVAPANGDYEGAGIGVAMPFKQPSHGSVLTVDNQAFDRIQRVCTA
ncbi:MULTISPECIES: hypothetical protein [unclassified Nocardiopsis]|nr:hypothetical protein [Nocardiopsis sp. TSRI0078]